MLNTILGGRALTGRIGAAVREQNALVYTLSSSFATQLYGGPFRLSLGTAPGSTAEVTRIVEREVRRIRDEGVTRDEVAEAVSHLAGGLTVQLETNPSVALWLADSEWFGHGPDGAERRWARLRGVTVEDVNAAARKHLHPEAAVTVVAGEIGAR